MNLKSITNHPEFGKLALRALIGGLMIVVGIPKFLGGSSTMESIGGAMSIYGITFAPVFWGFMAALTETLGGFFLILGYKTRIAALCLTLSMTTATLYMYKSGNADILKYGWPLAMAIIFFSLIFIGPGRFSVDKG